MKIKTSIKPMTAAAGVALLTGLAMMPISNAASHNPFAAQDLTSGYEVAGNDKGAEGKCGEAKCGADKKAKADAEATCGADKKVKADVEGKCGEAKCGADKKPAQG
ncbi:MAG: low-complexity protein [Oceanospirillales bacterium]|nr:low-complexity protein [Oceanospirillales bacterium]MBR9886970.1 low-complexity protein [Oceanospirillales bacterium]